MRLDVVVEQLLGVVPPHDINRCWLDVEHPPQRHQESCLLSSKHRVGDVDQFPQCFALLSVLTARPGLGTLSEEAPGKVHVHLCGCCVVQAQRLLELAQLLGLVTSASNTGSQSSVQCRVLVTGDVCARLSHTHRPCTQA